MRELLQFISAWNDTKFIPLIFLKLKRVSLFSFSLPIPELFRQSFFGSGIDDKFPGLLSMAAMLTVSVFH